MSDALPLGGSDGLLQRLDAAPLNRRYWLTLGLMTATTVLEFFDFFIVGFLVSVLAPAWQLSYGQSSIILLSAGVGAIVGSIVCGIIADRVGRKWPGVAGVALCALASGGIAFLPDGAWIGFAVLRFLVGFGMAGAATVGVPLLVEYTPTRHRTFIVSVVAVPVPLGILLASIAAATLLPVIGWRGLAALGFLPLISALLMIVIIPESVRWLVARGRLDQARRTAASILNVPVSTLPALEQSPQAGSSGTVLDLFRDGRRFWLTVIIWFGASTANYGVFLWGPTIVALLLGATPAEAAQFFVLVSLAGMAGRVGFVFLAHKVGRLRAGEAMGYGTALLLGLAGIFHDQAIGGVPVFLPLLLLAAVFFDGGFSNLGPYSAEIFPVRLSARGVGLAQAANGIGKIAGPLLFALVAGSGAAVGSAASEGAASAVFLLLAAFGLAVGLAFTFLGIETHGRKLSLGGEEAP